MAVKFLASKLLCLILSILTLLFTVLILIAGVNPNVLANFFFLKTDTSNLNIPSQLSTSTFLNDLSTLTGNDLVGKNASAQSLGLALSYTIDLFTMCAEDSSSTTCSPPQFGFQFDPASHLSLDSTAMQGSLPSNLLQSLSSYSKVSLFLAVAYILAAVLTAVAAILDITSSRLNSVAIASTTISTLATLFLLGASTAGIVAFSNLNGNMNSALSPVGITTILGKPLFILSWVAAILSLITSALISIQMRRTLRLNRQEFTPGSKPRAAIGKEDMTLDPRPLNRKPTLLQRIPTWGRHRYTEIQKQPVVVQDTGGFVADDHDPLVTHGAPLGAHDELDYSYDGIRGVHLHDPPRLSGEEDISYDGVRGINLQHLRGSPERELLGDRNA